MIDAKQVLHRMSPIAYSRVKGIRDSILISRHKAMDDYQVRSELESMYLKRIGKPLNLDNPKSYTEKIQWRKLNEITETITRLTDKYAVREWVADAIGSEYLIPLLGCWKNSSDIPFDELPKEYVLKTNNASGTNIIVRDSGSINVESIRHRLDEWLQYEMGWIGFELQYLGIEPCILAEQLMHDDGGTEDLRDYKFLCFDGEPKFIWVDVDRSKHHARSVFDTNWKLQPWNQYRYPTAGGINPPDSLAEMLELAARLSQGFSHVRVDLYEIGGKPYFGEMTFTNGSGFEPILPDEYDIMLGSMWRIHGDDGK